jgi:aquaporin Z
LIAEFIGTFFLCFAGIAAILSTVAPVSSGIGLIGVALAHVLALSVAVCCFGGISGAHFNPAVTIGFLSVGMISVGRAIAYIVIQVLGSVAGAAVCLVVYPLACTQATHLGIPLPPMDGVNLSPNVTLNAVLILEFVMTFLLMVAIFGTAVDSRGEVVKIGAFGIGLAVTFNILAGGPLTGASLNPARSLGPTLVYAAHRGMDDMMKAIWNLHWVYWAAPIAGAVVGAHVYHYLLLDRKVAESET